MIKNVSAQTNNKITLQRTLDTKKTQKKISNLRNFYRNCKKSKTFVNIFFSYRFVC